MQGNKLFRRSRSHLAAWYSGVMGTILSLSALGVYEAIAHAHWVTVDRELESVAGTLRDSLERTFQQPGSWVENAKQVLPDLCVVRQNCAAAPVATEGHILSAADRDGYYVRMLDSAGELVALTGRSLQDLRPAATTPGWASLQDSNGARYRQISLPLETPDDRPWGTLQVGRSLQDFDAYLRTVRWIMVLGLPLAMSIVGGASWWLAGLAMQPIYRSYQQVQQFTADAAHELRTPLAAVRATIESVLRLPSISEAEARETLRILERQNQRLADMASDLLLLSRLERQGCDRHQPCCLQDIIGDIEEELAALAIAEQVKLCKEFRVDRPLEVLGNEEQLYRLAFNLVTNGIQHTPSGGTVAMVLDVRDRFATLRIRDTGVGIAPEHQAKIFDRFYRIEGDRARRTGGSGLGLAIVRAIAIAHRGSIEVESQIDQGSCFTVFLPKVGDRPQIS